MSNAFENGHVGIRYFHPNDAAPLHAATRESIQELCRWMVWCHPDYGCDEARAFIEKCPAELEQGSRYNFAIYSPKGGELLGSVGLSKVDRIHGCANLGYWVRTTWTRKGVASAAVRLAARFAFEELGLNRLELIIPIGNRASIRVAEKLGAHFEGILKARLRLRGKGGDALGYSLLADEFKSHDWSV